MVHAHLQRHALRMYRGVVLRAESIGVVFTRANGWPKPFHQAQSPGFKTSRDLHGARRPGAIKAVIPVTGEATTGKEDREGGARDGKNRPLAVPSKAHAVSSRLDCGRSHSSWPGECCERSERRRPMRLAIGSEWPTRGPPSNCWPSTSSRRCLRPRSAPLGLGPKCNREAHGQRQRTAKGIGLSG